MKRIDTRKDLLDLAEFLGVRDSWHEPDEQGITVEMKGNRFDNAGHWPNKLTIPEDPHWYLLEKHIIISQNHKPIACVNLATLFAWACEYKDE